MNASEFRSASRLAYTEALDDEKAVTAVFFWHRAVAFFAAHGITPIHRVRVFGMEDESGLRRMMSDSRLHPPRRIRMTKVGT